LEDDSLPIDLGHFAPSLKRIKVRVLLSFALSLILVGGGFGSAAYALGGGVRLSSSANSPSVGNLRADALVAPLGIDDATPKLSWTMSSATNGVAQSGYQIQAASTAAALAAGTGLLWDTGQVSSAAQYAQYAGTALTSRSAVVWQVRVWDSTGAVSSWSSTTTFELGLTKATDWTSQWITDPHWTGNSPGISSSSRSPVTATFASVQARYVKLNITKLGLSPSGDSKFYAQLAEVQVFGPTSPATDLALGKTVTTSDSLEGWGWGRQDLTDGANDTQNASARGWSTNGVASADTSGSPVWVTIDLGSVQTVNSVSLWPRTDFFTSAGTTTSFPVSYTVQTSSTDSQSTSFTVQYTATNSTPPLKPTPPTTVTFPAVQARYVRLNITGLGALPSGSTTYYAQLAELQVFGTTPGDLALGKTVTASDSLEAYGWSQNYLTDGVNDSLNSSAHGWSSNSYASANISSTPISVVIDLGSVQTVSSVKLYERNDYLSTTGGTPSFPVNYTIGTSATTNVAASFTTQSTVTGQAAPPVQTQTTASMPLLDKQFTTTGTPVKARLFVSGIGIVVPSLNGQNVGNSVLAPGDSNLGTRLGYSEYDVTSLLRAGAANVLGIALGLGDRYIQPTSAAQGNRYVKFSTTPATGLPRATAQLEITYSDGSVQTISTDGTWTSRLGPTTVTAWYGGESYDARLETAGWNSPGAASTSSYSAAVTTAPFSTTRLVGLTSPPLQVVSQNTGTDLGSPIAGSELYNFGVNAAGWEQFTISAPAGTTLTFTPGEILQNGQAEQDNGNLGTPVYDTFTSNGTTETWHPNFDYHGFQYIQVSGIVAGVTITAPTQLVIRASNASVGQFTSSDSTVNSIYKLVDRAVQSNMMSILTDCPSREKLGWNEEVGLLFDMIARNYDIEAYGRTLVTNLADAQLSNGLVPDIAPEATVFSGGFRDDVNWGSSMIQLPWSMYTDYGDTATLQTYYPNMAAYLAYLQTRATGNLVVYGASGLGDWGETSVTSVTTPVDLVENWGYYRDEVAMANIATVLGKTSDAATYRSAAAATLAAFTAKWYNSSTQTVANGTQSAMAMALDIGAVPSAGVSAVTAKLVSAINSAGGLAVGEIGLTPMFRVLSQTGNDALAYQIVTANKVGGYGYFVAQGATSLPEYWNLTGSHNHFMLGAVDNFISGDLAGIQQAAGSHDFASIVIKPAVVGGMTRASGSLQTNHGLISSSWTVGTAGVILTATIPVGSTATIDVPVSGTSLPATPTGATYLGTTGGYAQYSVGSGSWVFSQ
jgi:alpha-L-rhamnosidase